MAVDTHICGLVKDMPDLAVVPGKYRVCMLGKQHQMSFLWEAKRVKAP